MKPATRSTLLIVGLIVALLMILPLLAGAFGIGIGMMGSGLRGWKLGVSEIWLLLTWAAVIAGVVWGVRAIIGSSCGQTYFRLNLPWTSSRNAMPEAR